MRIIAHRTISEYGKQHSVVKTALNSWYKTTKLAKWKNFQDIKSTFNSVMFSILKGTIIV
ncbi:MAG: type II toxin-antitoxin system HigB family toxin [Marinilabiliaceae bacterium]|nr:type II toxin-antitoxin system HigB family toxin [Marinilabiliaceae bacterium]